jgi:heat shock protein HtpX
MSQVTQSNWKAGIRTTILLASLTGLLVLLGALIGGPSTALTFLVIGAVINLGAYWFSDKIALKMSRAKPLNEEDAPRLHQMVRELAHSAGLPMPRLYVIPASQPNAFATGRSPKHAAVAVTTGLWRRLEPHEVEAVLAHELSHIANRDVLVMTLASFFAMLAGLLTRFGLYGGLFSGGDRGRDTGGVPIWLIIFLVSLLTYFISYLLIRAISRYREYAADRGSALITGAPENLMSALQKIASGIMQIPQRDLREVEAMNAFFIVPTSVKSATAELFASHPPLEKRLARLAEIAREMGKPVQ